MGGPRIHNVCVLLMYSVVAFCKDFNLSTVGRPWPLHVVKDLHGQTYFMTKGIGDLGVFIL